MTGYWGLGPRQVTSGQANLSHQGSRTPGPGMLTVSWETPYGAPRPPTSLTSIPGKSGTCLPQPTPPQGRWHLDPNVPPDVLFLHPHFWLPQTCLESFLPPCLPPRHLLPIPTHTELITGHAGGFPVPSQ